MNCLKTSTSVGHSTGMSAPLRLVNEVHREGHLHTQHDWKSQ